jgi:hypothetical protein
VAARSQQLAQQLIQTFTDWVNALQAEQNEKLYRADWAEKYGETLNKGDACKILNRSRFYLEKLIDTNQVKINADGQILTRSLQQFAETSPEHKRHMRKQAQRQTPA